MKIPYGESDFKKIRRGKYLYIDKTAYIQQLEEQGSFNILLRPRRFGKSLFLSTLLYYYDTNQKGHFETLFSNLHIGDNPTTLKNSYQVLFMEFSGIADTDAKAVEQEFRIEVQKRLCDFLRRYGYPAESLQQVKAAPSAASSMKIFFYWTVDANIYLMIDEYDHFANSILGTSLERFREIVGRGGFMRSFYETVKTATMEGIVDRFFITGVTSITLDSMTSGFNIGENITHHRLFNQVLGFTEEETENIVEPLARNCSLDRIALMNDLKQWYNGYLFSDERTERVYNADMVLYFAKNFNRETCAYPKAMLDDNIASDYKKIMQLFGIGDRTANFTTLEKLLTNGEIIGLHSRKLSADKKFEQNDFIALLLYMGFITITGTLLNRLRYGIPNYVIQKLYYDYFKEEIEQRAQISIPKDEIENAVAELALHNSISPLTEEIGKVLALFSNRDFMNMDEKHIKAVILTLLYQSEAYFIRSEPEVNNRYPDILLLERSPFELPNQFLFELKFCKKKDGKKGWEQKREEGVRQVQGYLELEDVRCLDKLRAYLLLTDGCEIEAIAVR
ncbi:MAG: AAA family ATPase [Candidatus Electrothrix sp. Rat3]|nr:AAA family ATPase [Candidatus Electrothrix rattekaaiensis]